MLRENLKKQPVRTRVFAFLARHALATLEDSKLAHLLAHGQRAKIREFVFQELLKHKLVEIGVD